MARQTLAHYEVGRARMPASMLPTVARLLTLSLDELMGQALPRAARGNSTTRSGKRGPASRLEQQIQAVAQLPKTKQQFVSQMLDTVLAQVKRNADRFPGDFMFQLNAVEKAEVVANCDHLAKLKFSKVLPYAFTEHGAIQAANVLASPQAVEMGIFVVRAFVRMRELAAVHADLAKRLDELEQKTEGLALSHDTFSRNTRAQLKQLIEAVNHLMAPPDPPKRPIGFVTHEDKGKEAQARSKT